MGILDSMKEMSNKLAGDKDGGSGVEAIVGSVFQLITQQGGLSQLLDKFQGNEELKNIVSSWIGQGQNLPINTDQLKSALGPDTLNSLTQKTGMNENNLLSQLTSMLPSLVDKLTPSGSVDNNQPTLEHLVMAGVALFTGKKPAGGREAAADASTPPPT